MKIFKYQQWHFLILSVLLIGIYFCVNTDPSLLQGNLLGIDTYTWFIIALISPIIHQLYVLLCWRSELHYNSITKIFGENGFKWFQFGFGILILSRLISIILLAVSNSGTFRLSHVYVYLLAFIFLAPAVHLFYSVNRYFGIDRASGLDHFKPEEAGPFVKKGIFKYTSNGMYIFGFLILWIPGLITQSKAAILIALFNHLYIWVHYYFTELPDIKFIYVKR